MYSTNIDNVGRSRSCTMDSGVGISEDETDVLECIQEGWRIVPEVLANDPLIRRDVEPMPCHKVEEKTACVDHSLHEGHLRGKLGH